MISLAASGVAAVVSALALSHNRSKDRHDLVRQAQKDKRDLFWRRHDRLMDLDCQRGRHILAHSVRSAKEAERLCDRREDYELVCNTLSLLDTLAVLFEQGDIDESSFMREWALTYLNLKEKVILLAAARKKRRLDYNDFNWPNFLALAHTLSGKEIMARKQALPNASLIKQTASRAAGVAHASRRFKSRVERSMTGAE
jgi:hypothetical protein